MVRLIVVIAIVAGVAYAWQKGWISRWFTTAVDSSVDSVKRTQREATKVRPIDTPPEEKK